MNLRDDLQLIYDWILRRQPRTRFRLRRRQAAGPLVAHKNCAVTVLKSIPTA